MMNIMLHSIMGGHFVLIFLYIIQCFSVLKPVEGCNPGSINLNWRQKIGKDEQVTKEEVPVGRKGWGEWHEWSQCSRTCGEGSRSRARSCLNTNYCPGQGTETSKCNATPCAEWSYWFEWSDCSATCGQGYTRRQRQCLGRPGEECPGNPETIEPCNVKECPSWGGWQSWGGCSATCGKGTVERNRSCSVSGKCTPGSKKETKPCEREPCSRWDNWEVWSTCSVSCGSGTKKRTRTCLGDGKCLGPREEMERCSQPVCNPWSEWSPWSPCGVTCGTTQTHRIRQCLLPNINSCSGEPLMSKDCGLAGCEGQGVVGRSPPAASWGGWTAWTPCDCDSRTRQRNRICSSTGCVGSGVGVEHCDAQGCAKWSNWDEWGPCSESCGQGMQMRRRTCLGGRTVECSGPYLDFQQCPHLPFCRINFKLQSGNFKRGKQHEPINSRRFSDFATRLGNLNSRLSSTSTNLETDFVTHTVKNAPISPQNAPQPEVSNPLAEVGLFEFHVPAKPLSSAVAVNPWRIRSQFSRLNSKDTVIAKTLSTSDDIHGVHSNSKSTGPKYLSGNRPIFPLSQRRSLPTAVNSAISIYSSSATRVPQIEIVETESHQGRDLLFDISSQTRARNQVHSLDRINSAGADGRSVAGFAEESVPEGWSSVNWRPINTPRWSEWTRWSDCVGSCRNRRRERRRWCVGVGNCVGEFHETSLCDNSSHLC